MTAVQIVRGADATINVRWRQVGDLSAHTLLLFDVSPRLRDRVTVSFISYDEGADESLLRVDVEGTDPIQRGEASLRIQATLSGSSVSTLPIAIVVV